MYTEETLYEMLNYLNRIATALEILALKETVDKIGTADINLNKVKLIRLIGYLRDELVMDIAQEKGLDDVL